MISNLKIKGRKLYTKNLMPGKTVYGENLTDFDNKEYRTWDPRRSKFAAALIKGSRQIRLNEGEIVLYLGASSGTTASHVSDIVGSKGFVFAMDFAPRVMRELVYLCEQRKNITPILADASKPEEYSDKVQKPVDFLYQDIAQKKQVEIFLDNVNAFLKKSGIGCLTVKARSIDVAGKPQKIFNQVRETLKKCSFVKILEQVNLEPFEKDHCMFIIEKK